MQISPRTKYHQPSYLLEVAHFVEMKISEGSSEPDLLRKISILRR